MKWEELPKVSTETVLLPTTKVVLEEGRGSGKMMSMQSFPEQMSRKSGLGFANVEEIVEARVERVVERVVVGERVLVVDPVVGGRVFVVGVGVIVEVIKVGKEELEDNVAVEVLVEVGVAVEVIMEVEVAVVIMGVIEVVVVEMVVVVVAVVEVVGEPSIRSIIT